MIIVNEIKLDLEDSESILKVKIEKKLKCSIKSFTIKKKSLDARKKPCYVYSCIVDSEYEDLLIKKGYLKYQDINLIPPVLNTNSKVIIIGYGPSGIFSAYRLVEAGFKVSVFEKGKRINERVKDVDLFFKEGVLNEESNVQFGEGGAGTFSDAKLTTRIKNPYIDYMLDILVKHGADESIKYDHHPHIGTDKIRDIISNITDYLISKGCDFHFSEAVEHFEIKNNHIEYIQTKQNKYNADYYLLGIGHSSYDTVLSLKDAGVYIEQKDIAIGFRVEHPQSYIDERQSNSEVKEANEYFLRYKGDKGVYSFCMCPGGIVVPAMSEKNSIVTNGMSYSKRDSKVANSAILIQVPCSEFNDGYIYLKAIETKAYEYSKSYKALAQNIKDFMNNELNPLIFDSTYLLGTVLYDFNNFFNKKDLRIVKQALIDFDHKIPGFIEKGIMVGPETRSSCPIRILRNESYVSVNTDNLYPMGEGSGYGGGIISCGLDGIKISNIIISNEQV